MVIYSDSRDYLARITPALSEPEIVERNRLDPGLSELAASMFDAPVLFAATVAKRARFKALFAEEEASSSHYDLLIDLSRRGIELPDGTLCLAGSGLRFHGQRGRPWKTLPGNIHLSVYLTPQQRIEDLGMGFSILAAVSIIETIDRIHGLEGRAGIKWVNDILIDGSKVAGFLAFTQSQEGSVQAAILGIGLNVESAPDIPGDDYVPRASSLREFLPETASCGMGDVLTILVERLEDNLSLLIRGGYSELLARYRERSLVLGRQVIIRSDPVGGIPVERCRGRVLEIGENLELSIEGREEPITSGRLVLVD